MNSSSISSLSSLISNECLLNQSQALTTPQFLYLNGELRIDGNYSFAAGSEIIMGDMAQIVLLPDMNIELGINSTNIHGCQSRWNGIAVTKSSIIRVSASTIKDSNRGIILFDGSNSGIIGNTFENNMVSISTPNLYNLPQTQKNIPALAQSIILNQSAGGIVANTFKVTGTLLPSSVDPFTNPTGIYLEWNSYFRIGGTTPSLMNIFDNLTNGIRAINTDLEVVNSQFINFGIIGLGFDFNGINITGSLAGDLGEPFQYNKISTFKFIGLGKEGPVLFENCTYAIVGQEVDFEINNLHIGKVFKGIGIGGRYFEGKLENIMIDDFDQAGFDLGYPDKSLRVLNNKISNTIATGGMSFLSSAICLLGISPFFHASHGVVIKDNLILNNVPNDPFSFGIKLSVCGNARVESNSIISNNSRYIGLNLGFAHECTVQANNIKLDPPNSNGSFNIDEGGLGIQNSIANRIACNSTQGFAEGLGFRSNCDGSDIYSNTMKSHKNYLRFITPETITGVQYNKMNQWPDNNLGSTTKAEAYWPGGVSPLLSRFTSDQNQTSLFPEPIVGPIDWFLNQPLPIEGYPCVNYGPPTGDGGTGLKNQLTAANVALLDNNLSFPNFNSSHKWEVELQLMEKLTKYPNLISLHPQASNFYSNNSTGTLGQLQGVILNLETIMKPSNSLLNLLATSDSISTMLRSQIAAINQQILFEPNEAIKASLNIQLNSLQTQLRSQKLVLDNLTSTWAANQLLGSSSALTVLNSVNTTKIPEINLKAVLGIILGSIQTGNYPKFTAAQKQGLESIAANCGYEGGRGVYWARELLRKSPNFYNDDVLCLPPPAPMAAGTPIQTELKLYPNPVENILHIELPIASGSIDYSIHNSLGLSILSGVLSNNAINVSSLPSGLYILSLSTDNTKLSTTKFIKK